MRCEPNCPDSNIPDCTGRLTTVPGAPLSWFGAVNPMSWGPPSWLVTWVQVSGESGPVKPGCWGHEGLGLGVSQTPAVLSAPGLPLPGQGPGTECTTPWSSNNGASKTRLTGFKWKGT